MIKKQKYLEEVEEILQGLENVDVNTFGHMKPCRYRTFLKQLADNEIELLYTSYDKERIESVINEGYELPELSSLVFGRNSNTTKYSKEGVKAIEELFGLMLPKTTPYTIVQAILKDPKAILTNFSDQ